MSLEVTFICIIRTHGLIWTRGLCWFAQRLAGSSERRLPGRARKYNSTVSSAASSAHEDVDRAKRPAGRSLKRRAIAASTGSKKDLPVSASAGNDAMQALTPSITGSNKDQPVSASAENDAMQAWTPSKTQAPLVAEVDQPKPDDTSHPVVLVQRPNDPKIASHKNGTSAPPTAGTKHAVEEAPGPSVEAATAASMVREDTSNAAKKARLGDDMDVGRQENDAIAKTLPVAALSTNTWPGAASSGSVVPPFPASKQDAIKLDDAIPKGAASMHAIHVADKTDSKLPTSLETTAASNQSQTTPTPTETSTTALSSTTVVVANLASTCMAASCKPANSAEFPLHPAGTDTDHATGKKMEAAAVRPRKHAMEGKRMPTQRTSQGHAATKYASATGTATTPQTPLATTSGKTSSLSPAILTATPHQTLGVAVAETQNLPLAPTQGLATRKKPASKVASGVKAKAPEVSAKIDSLAIAVSSKDAAEASLGIFSPKFLALAHKPQSQPRERFDAAAAVPAVIQQEIGLAEPNPGLPGLSNTLQAPAGFRRGFKPALKDAKAPPAGFRRGFKPAQPKPHTNSSSTVEISDISAGTIGPDKRKRAGDGDRTNNKLSATEDSTQGIILSGAPSNTTGASPTIPTHTASLKQSHLVVSPSRPSMLEAKHVSREQLRKDAQSKRLGTQFVCLACKTHMRDVLLNPCNHMLFCHRCIAKLAEEDTPVTCLECTVEATSYTLLEVEVEVPQLHNNHLAHTSPATAFVYSNIARFCFADRACTDMQVRLRPLLQASSDKGGHGCVLRAVFTGRNQRHPHFLHRFVHASPPLAISSWSALWTLLCEDQVEDHNKPPRHPPCIPADQLPAAQVAP